MFDQRTKPDRTFETQYHLLLCNITVMGTIVGTANYPKHITIFQLDKLLYVCPLYPSIFPLYPYYWWLKPTDKRGGPQIAKLVQTTPITMVCNIHILIT